MSGWGGKRSVSFPAGAGVACPTAAGLAVREEGRGQLADRLFALLLRAAPGHAKQHHGAVMGAKNLKAIVVRGKEKPQYADAKGFHATVKEDNKYIMDKPASQGLHLVGTAGGHPTTDKFGDNAILNWRGGNWTEGTIKTSGKAIAETIFSRHTFCYACPIGCGKAIEIKEGPYAGVHGEGPEYETLCGFGSNLQCDDLNAVSAMNASVTRTKPRTSRKEPNLKLRLTGDPNPLLREHPARASYGTLLGIARFQVHRGTE